MRETLIKNLALRGKDKQIDKCVEECGELIQILMKYKDDDTLSNRVSEEIADVLITIESLKLIFGTEDIDVWTDFKIERLNKLYS